MRPLRRLAAFTLQLLLLQLTLLGGRSACERAIPETPVAGCEHDVNAAMPHQQHGAPATRHPAPTHAPCPDGSDQPAHCAAMATCSTPMVSLSQTVSMALTTMAAHEPAPRVNQHSPVTWRGAPEPPPPRA